MEAASLVVAEADCKSLVVVDTVVAAIVLVVARVVEVDTAYSVVVGMVVDCLVDTALLILSTCRTQYMFIILFTSVEEVEIMLQFGRFSFFRVIKLYNWS